MIKYSIYLRSSGFTDTGNEKETDILSSYELPRTRLLRSVRTGLYLKVKRLDWLMCSPVTADHRTGNWTGKAKK